MSRTFIYTRVSTLDQAEGTSLDSQRRKCEGAVMMAEREVTAVFTDAGVSGSVALNERPEGSVMTGLLASGDTVVVSKIDRAFRSAADAMATIEDWKKRGIALVVAEFGADPVTENGTSRLLFGLLAVVAEFERDLIRERMGIGRKEKVAKGGHIGGSAPFGFRAVGTGKGAMLEPVKVEQESVFLAREWVQNGTSIRKAVERLKAEGRPAPSHVALSATFKRWQDWIAKVNAGK